ncbi:unnamed protein product [Gadus morhua 'NCC']
MPELSRRSAIKCKYSRVFTVRATLNNLKSCPHITPLNGLTPEQHQQLLPINDASHRPAQPVTLPFQQADKPPLTKVPRGHAHNVSVQIPSEEPRSEGFVNEDDLGLGGQQP